MVGKHPRARSVQLSAVAVVAAIVVSSGCATLGAGHDESVNTIEAAARDAAAVDTVWPGYRPFERGFIIFQPGSGAWLTTDNAPPAPWSAAASSEPALEGRLYHRATDLPGLTGGIDTAYPVGDRTYTAVEFLRDVRSTLVRLYHEAFHTWQLTSFPENSGGEFVPTAGTAPSVIASIELERRILADALRAGDEPRADSLIAAFLAVRSQRMAASSDTVRIVDRMLERVEGTAHLVGYQGAAAALRLDPARVTNVVIEALEGDLAEYAADPANRYYRWRAYGTGSAIGLLLDRLGAEWREPVAAGTPLDSLLLRAARIPPSPELVAIARERSGYNELLRRAERDAPPASDDPIAEFLARAPHRLVIEIVMGTTSKPSMSFDPGSAGWNTPEPSVALLTEVERASMTGSGFDLSLTNRPLMIDGRGAPVFRLIVLLPEPPRVNDAPAAPMSGPTADSLRITGRDTEVIVPGENVESITVEDGIVTLRVRAE